MSRNRIKSIFNQFNYVISQNFTPGASKYQDKHDINYNRQNTIYSYADREQLRDTAKTFGQFCKDEGIKQVKDIKQEHIVKYLDMKSKTCTQRTIEQDASRINKLMNMSSNTFKMDLVHVSTKDIPKSQKRSIRTFAMPESDYQKAFEDNRDSRAKMGVQLAHEFGLRSNEIVCLQVGDIKGDRLHISHGSKGGRERIIIAETKEQKDLIKKLSDYAKRKDMSDSNRIIGIAKTSLHKYEREHLKKHFGQKYNHTNNHAIRKNYAERTYLRYRQEGKSHKDAWGKTSENLGHSFDREGLFKVYCPNLNQ